MTYEESLRQAFVLAAERKGMSIARVHARCVELFGEKAPSKRTVERAFNGTHAMTVQTMDMVSQALDVNLIDALARATPGQAAQYRCILPSEVSSVNAQVSGLEVEVLSLLHDSRHTV